MPLFYRSAKAKDNEAGANLVPIANLSIYRNPEEANEYVYVMSPPTTFDESVAATRQFMLQQMDNYQTTTSFVQNTYSTGRSHLLGTVEYIQSDEGFLVKAGVISLSGIGGLLLGFRGGVVKKLFYSSTLMAAAASLCYPKQSIELASRSWATITDSAKEQFGGIKLPASMKSSKTASSEPSAKQTKKQSVITTEPAEPTASASSTKSSPHSVILLNPPESSPMPASIQGDMGQSNPADKDLYANRSS